jgi:DNA processing protein
VSTLTSATDQAVAEQVLQWLALGLTPGLGPTRARRLVEHFGSVAALFRVSLTELEATGLLAVSAQSLGTGNSLELAQVEVAKATTAGVHVVSLDDPAYPPRLRQIYDPPLVLYVRGD